jgi:hypothetical protein
MIIVSQHSPCDNCIPAPQGECWDTIIIGRALGYIYQSEGAGIQLSQGECWDTIIIGRVLGYNYHREGAGIQLS